MWALIRAALCAAMGCGGSKSSADAIDESDVKITRAPEACAPAVDEAAAAREAASLEQERRSEEERVASTRLQSAVRAKRARQRVDRLRGACSEYRVNMQAEKFGECVCGWPKAAHSAESLAAKKETSKRHKRVGSGELRGKMVQKGFCACERYVVDMESANFGQCGNCGAPKADHSPEALSAAGEVSKAAHIDSDEVRARFVHKETVQCERFEADLNADGFGVCVCGAARAEHSEAALAAAAAKATSGKRAESPDVRKGFTKTAAWEDRETVQCDAFVLDMAPGAPFGMCVCGAPKAKHSDKALAAR